MTNLTSRLGAAGRIALAIVAFAATPAAASTGGNYDGQWTVTIASARPHCGGGTSVSLAIAKGQIAPGGVGFNASGRVGDSGAISVTMSSGIKRANGSGRLNGNAGSGTWRGDLCSGTWTAQRI